MAADILANPGIKHTPVHDLESAFYIVFWLSISLRLLRNNWSSDERGIVMHNLFNPPAFPTAGTPNKRDWMIATHFRQTK